MLELVRVKVADIHPLTDEYGNTFLSRDYALPANVEYVKRLAASFGPSGEPDEQIKLVRDGDGYAIKAGNTRVMAMRELGTEECWAVIDSEDTVQSVLETVVRTDAKKCYEPIELSRFNQQLFLFGDDEYVSSVSQIGVEEVGRMRRGRALAGDRAEQFTLDRLEALGEFDGDEKAVKAIEDASERDLASVLARLRRERKDEAAKAEFRRRAEELRIDLDGGNIYSLTWAGSCSSPDDLEKVYMVAAADHTEVVGRVSSAWDGVYVKFYGKPMVDAEKAKAVAERNKRIDEANRQADAVDESVHAWLEGKLSGPGEPRESMPAIHALAKAWAEKWHGFDDLYDMFPAFMECDLPPIAVALLWSSQARTCRDVAYYAAIDDPSPYQRGLVAKSVGPLDACIADGWQPPEGSEGFIEELRGAASEDGSDD